MATNKIMTKIMMPYSLVRVPESIFVDFMVTVLFCIQNKIKKMYGKIDVLSNHDYLTCWFLYRMLRPCYDYCKSWIAFSHSLVTALKLTVRVMFKLIKTKTPLYVLQMTSNFYGELLMLLVAYHQIFTAFGHA